MFCLVYLYIMWLSLMDLGLYKYLGFIHIVTARMKASRASLLYFYTFEFWIRARLSDVWLLPRAPRCQSVAQIYEETSLAPVITDVTSPFGIVVGRCWHVICGHQMTDYRRGIEVLSSRPANAMTLDQPWTETTFLWGIWCWDKLEQDIGTSPRYGEIQKPRLWNLLRVAGQRSLPST